MKPQLAVEMALKQVKQNANPLWLDYALASVKAVAVLKQRFTVDDVQEVLLAIDDAPRTHNTSALGVAMRRAQKNGWIFLTSEVKPSKRTSRHMAQLRVWVSRVYDHMAPQQPLFEQA